MPISKKDRVRLPPPPLHRFPSPDLPSLTTTVADQPRAQESRRGRDARPRQGQRQPRQSAHAHVKGTLTDRVSHDRGGCGLMVVWWGGLVRVLYEGDCGVESDAEEGACRDA